MTVMSVTEAHRRLDREDGEAMRTRVNALPTVEDLEAVLGPSVNQLAESRSDKINRLRAYALTSASLAREIGRHPTHSWSPVQAGLLWSMADMLTAIADEKPVELSSAYRQSSSPADMARAKAVAEAVGGENA